MYVCLSGETDIRKDRQTDRQGLIHSASRNMYTLSNASFWLLHVLAQSNYTLSTPIKLLGWKERVLYL